MNGACYLNKDDGKRVNKNKELNERLQTTTVHRDPNVEMTFED